MIRFGRSLTAFGRKEASLCYKSVGLISHKDERFVTDSLFSCDSSILILTT